MKKLLVGACGAVGLVVLAYWSATRPERGYAAPVRLLDKFYSYASIEQISDYLRERSVTFELEISNEKHINGSRPPFIFDYITLNNYMDSAVRGELRLVFYNNRLMRVSFYPVDIDGYRANFAAAHKTEYPTSDGYLISEQVWLRSGANAFDSNDHPGIPYVAWADIRLVREADAWIARYD